MFEVQAANFKKGIFEIQLRKSIDIPFLRSIWRLGPVRGRLVGLGGLLFAFLLGVNKAPSRFFLENQWVADERGALLLQNRLMWMVVVAFALFYVLVSLFREASLHLDFDRQKECVYLHYIPHFSLAARRDGVLAFREIREIRVFSPEEEPKTPFGRISILGLATAPKAFRHIEFALLTHEQREFFPLNINRITDLSPQGSWVDPDAGPDLKH